MPGKIYGLRRNHWSLIVFIDRTEKKDRPNLMTIVVDDTFFLIKTFLKTTYSLKTSGSGHGSISSQRQFALARLLMELIIGI